MSQIAGIVLMLFVAAVVINDAAAQEKFNGLSMGLGTLSRLAHAKTRSISPENFTGEKGKAGMATTGTGAQAARDLGQGWKISPSVKIKAGETFPMASVEGSGAIQHMWMTPAGNWRHMIFRIYWDGEATPSVEVPVGDFFACAWGEYNQISSIAVCVNPGSGLNCYWEMPFRKGFRITMENIGKDDASLYYQIDYTLTDVPAEAAYFHAQFRLVTPLAYKDVYTILEGVKGWGQYVGTYMIWGANTRGWWGEGEIKFYMDGDKEFPTICGTGTEDYFCGSYGFENKLRQYQDFTTPFTGFTHVIPAGSTENIQQRFGLYRWHIMDPVRFEKDLRVTMHALGWQTGGRYLPLQDDIASVAFWYQTEPHAPFPKLPGKDDLHLQYIKLKMGN